MSHSIAHQHAAALNRKMLSACGSKESVFNTIDFVLNSTRYRIPYRSHLVSFVSLNFGTLWFYVDAKKLFRFRFSWKRCSPVFHRWFATSANTSTFVAYSVVFKAAHKPTIILISRRPVLVRDWDDRRSYTEMRWKCIVFQILVGDSSKLNARFLRDFEKTHLLVDVFGTVSKFVFLENPPTVCTFETRTAKFETRLFRDSYNSSRSSSASAVAHVYLNIDLG